MSGVSLETYEKYINTLGLEDRDGQRIATYNLVALCNGPSGDSLALQAPTGTGKSVAALLAAVDAVRGGSRVAIGTATVMLSEQYWEDIEKVSSVFTDVEFFVLKGASHYICLNNAESHINSYKKRGHSKWRDLQRDLDTWINGESEDVLPPSWAQANTDNCSDCRSSSASADKSGKCEYAIARAKALTADVVVTSHAMLMIDLGIKRDAIHAEDNDLEPVTRQMLGDIDIFIFDEAHKLGGLLNENSLNVWDIRHLVSYNVIATGMGFHRGGNFMEHFEKLDSVGAKVRFSIADTWSNPSSLPANAEALLELWPTEAEIKKMWTVQYNLDAVDRRGDIEQRKVANTIRTITTMRKALVDISAGSISGDLAFWMSGTGYAIKEMEIRPWFSDTLAKFKTAYMSATLGINRPGYERYSLNTLGVKVNWDFDVESPFDYSSQMEVSSVDWKHINGYGPGLVNCVEWLHKTFAGGTVVLSANHKDKAWINNEMLSRGILSRSQSNPGRGSAKRDRQTMVDHGSNNILVGVDTFSTGMNLSGSRLTKLFIQGIKPIRDDRAYVEWRKRWIERNGGDSFYDYELPEKAIVLEQQIGRLIRTKADWGSVVLGYRTADPRESEVVQAALSSFVGYTEVALPNVGQAWQGR